MPARHRVVSAWLKPTRRPLHAGRILSAAMNSTIPLRQPCPPGACDCERERLLDDPDADWRVLRLTREEEKRLIARLEQLQSLDDLRHMQRRLYDQVGIEVTVAPGRNEVRTVRGIQVQVAQRTGLCRKLRQSIPTAIRRAMQTRPEIAFALLDAKGLFGDDDDARPTASPIDT